MTPQEALNLLTQATGLLQLKRDEHQQIVNALNVLNSIVNQPKDETKDDLPNKKK